MIQKRSQNAQWMPAGFSIREFGAKAHSRADSRFAQPRAFDDELPEIDRGVIHVLNGKALTAKGRALLAQAKIQ